MDLTWIEFALAPAFGGLVGFGVWYFQSRIEKLQKEQEKLHDERRRVYSDILEPIIKIFAGMRDAKLQKEAVRQMQSIDYRRTAFQFSLVGDDSVVHSFNKLMEYIYALEEKGNKGGNKPDAFIIISLWGELLLEIRRQLGNPKTSLTAKDMLRSQIKGIDHLKRSE